MVVKINGVPVEKYAEKSNLKIISSMEESDLKDWLKSNYSKSDISKLKRLATFLWMTSASLLAVDSASAAGTGSLWTSMMPIFRMFQDIAMVLGAIALFCGLIIMMFKKAEGKKFVMTSAIVIGGCFVVPAAIMLIAIIGGMINDTLINVFQSSGLKNSIEVNGN